MRLLIVALFIFAGTLSFSVKSQASPERCETSKAGIKRCETTFHDPKNKSPDWKSIAYSDRKGSVVDLEVNFPKDVDLVWPAAFIGMNMSILNENATKEERGALFERLIKNAVSEKFELVKFGNYDWTSGKNGSTIIIRASRRSK
jgi:hypothetical protein